MKKINKNKILFDIYSIKTQIVLSLIIALLSFYTYNIFLILWEIFLISLYLKLPGTLNSLVGARIIFSTIVLFAFFQAQSLIYWALHIIINFNIYIYGSLFMILATLIVLNKFFGLKTNYYHKLSKNELVREFIIIVTPIILVSILIGGVFLYGGKGDVKYLSALSRSQDDATHAGFFASLLRSNGNINTDDRLGKLMPIKSTYPLGPHLGFAVFSSALTKSTNMKVVEEFKFYFLSKIIMVFGAIYIISMLIFSLYGKFKIKILSLIDLVILCFSVFVVSFVIIMPSYLDGFFSFIPALSLIALALIILIEKQDNYSFITFSFLMSIIAVSAALSWMLPVVIITSAYVLYVFSQRKQIKKLFKGLILFSVIVTALSCLQVFELFAEDFMRKLGLDLLLVAGGMFEPSIILAVALFFGFMLIYLNKKNRVFLKYSLFLIYPTIIIIMLITIYYVLKGYSLSFAYYLFKIIYLLMIILLPVCLVYLIKIIKNNPTVNNKLISLVILYSVFLVCSHFFFPRLANEALHFYVPSINNNVSKILIESSLNRFYNPSNERLVDAAKEDYQHWNMVSNNIARQSYRSETCDYFIYDTANKFALFKDNKTEFSTLISYIEYCVNKIPPINLYTDHKHYNDFKNSIPEKLLLEKKVILKSIN